MRETETDAARMSLDVAGAAPRFVLVEPAARRLALRLESIGWRPLASGTAIGALRAEDLVSAEAVVVSCTERRLLSSGFQAELVRLAIGRPRIAIVSANGAETAAYAARLGWTGFIAAESSALEIAWTIGRAARGELAFPPSAMSGLLRTLARVAPLNAFPAPTLTPRQRQIVTLIAQGATDIEIAGLLRIRPATATKHVQNARRRLSARTRGQLIAAIGTGRLNVANGRAS